MVHHLSQGSPTAGTATPIHCRTSDSDADTDADEDGLADVHSLGWAMTGLEGGLWIHAKM